MLWLFLTIGCFGIVQLLLAALKIARNADDTVSRMGVRLETPETLRDIPTHLPAAYEPAGAPRPTPPPTLPPGSDLNLLLLGGSLRRVA